MPTLDFVVESPISSSVRARQVGAMFDAPPSEKCRIEYHVEAPIDAEPWNVGLVVGPSGSGKTTVMRHLFGDPVALEWNAAGVVDDVAPEHGIQAISEAFGAVGFNTIPAWMRPFAVLSNGERFRVDLARRLLELPDPVVVDEFTSVVDRQVAQIGSHAIQKLVRRQGRRFVAVGCHYDVIDWLQPDWVLDMSTRQFTRRLLQRRPSVECTIGRLPRAAWTLFSPFHYLTAELHKAAACYGLWANGKLAAFTSVLHMPHAKVRDIKRVSRTVTLPDWQGLGLVFALNDQIGAAHRGVGLRLRVYPAHPAFVRAFDRAPKWKLITAPGAGGSANTKSRLAGGGRPCAVFEYCGEAMPPREARALLGGAPRAA